MAVMKLKKAIVNINNLNVRKGPGKEFPVAKTCEAGTFNVFAEQNGFVKIGPNEWVSAEFVTIEEEVKEEPKEEKKAEIKSKKKSIELKEANADG